MAGVTAGYVLGRMHKLKLALIVGSALANRKLVSAQVDKLTDAAGVGPLGEQLVSAGRKAAIGAVSSRIDSISDRLAERTEPAQRLRGGRGRGRGRAGGRVRRRRTGRGRDEEPAEDDEATGRGRGRGRGAGRGRRSPEDEYEEEEPAEEGEEEPVAEDEEFEDDEEYEEAAR